MMYVKNIFLLLLFFLGLTSYAQVGIGTTTPNTSALLEIHSDTKGFLTPRMTTINRLAISNPANGLLVYDTDESSFYYYKSSTWSKVDGTNKRDNYVLVKSQADFPAVSAGSITLDENVYYEINGEITLTASINLNGAYVAGLDAGEDVLNFPGGVIFKGATGGSIRNVTLKGSKAFEITGPGIASSESLLIQNTIINGMTTSVGSVSGIGLLFSNIVQFVGNKNGVSYSNIGNLLLNNQAWLGTNLGTYEKFTGNFGLIEKVSGFSTVNGSAVAIDVSADPVLAGSGVILGTVFTGTSATYINKYTTGSFAGYNFTNNWTVNCPGIPAESDNEATGNIYFDSAPVTVLGSSAIKLPVTTLSTRLFRMANGGVSNRLVYQGKKSRAINIFGAISFTAIGGMRVTFSIRKNGTIVSGTEVIYDIINTNDRQGLSIIGTVDVNPNDYIEIYVERNISSTPNQFLVTSYNLIGN
ncbi:hypothetical protein [Leeuwenhoekiella sp. MAR_2009_132]|uniref:hypothetical protein n=1 Tax=Leeuwenhoekiella sp. MAR_2009_132 TaxID=1392489 RepID=UPI00056D6520|nr:hypothetical protein [Leeuwenhoekiella sp. MAR_2009_132]